MEIKIKNPESNNVVSAFLGEDKFERIEDKLRLIALDTSIPKTSDTIKHAINLYADTPGEAIGISIFIFNLIVGKKEAQQRELEKILTGVTEIFGPKSLSMEIFKKMEGVPEELDEDKMLKSAPDEVFEEFFKKVSCEECPERNTCEILKEGKNRGLK